MFDRVEEFFIAHIIISFVYCMYVRFKTGGNTQSFSESAMVLVMPLFGILFLFGIRLTQWLNSSKERVEADIYHQYTGGRLILGEHEQYEEDIIALNDVLVMDNSRQKRALLTTAVKQNVLQNQDLLRRAIRDGDREVSHYAVSMVTTMVEGIERRLFDSKKKTEASPGDQKVLTEYAGIMGEYLKASFLDKTSRRKVEEEYSLVLERLIECSSDDPGVFEKKIDFELDFGNFARAEDYCRLFAQKFPLSEAPFISYIKLYQHLRDYKKFRAKINELKKCPIQLTPRALNIIRFWEPEKKYV